MALICVVAHRGALLGDPPNILESISRSVRSDLDAIEVDVQVSSDGIAILFHDENIAINGKTVPFESLTWEEIRNVEIQGRTIPKLEEVLSVASKYKKTVIMDVKSEDAIQPILEITSSISDTDGLAIASFNHDALRTAKKISPQIRRMLIIGFSRESYSFLGFVGTIKALLDPVATAREIGVQAIIIDDTRVSAEIVTKAHKSGLEVFVWQKSADWDPDSLGSLGVDGLISNDVESIKRARGIAGKYKKHKLP